MKFKEQLKNVTITGRKYRFIADITDVKGNKSTAYLSNNTKMIGIIDGENVNGMISPLPKKRRIKYNLELVFSQGALIGVNHENTVVIVKEALENKSIPELATFSYKDIFKESKGDVFELENEKGDKCLLIVRDIYFKKQSTLIYPDGINPAETGIIDKIPEWIEKNYKVVILYVAQRNDAIDARIGWEMDSDYAVTLNKAVNSGAEVLCYNSWISFKEIELKDKMEINLK